MFGFARKNRFENDFWELYLRKLMHVNFDKIDKVGEN